MTVSKFIFGCVLAFGLFFSGCSGGSDSTTSTATEIGIFLDSAVEGVKYQTSSGIVDYTNAKGEYQFKDGDTVEFLIGDISLGKIKAKKLISVLELNNPVKAAMLLQALDDDANPENGINITPEVFKSFDNTMLDLNSVDPDNEDFLVKFKELTGNDFKVDSASAIEHANYSLMLENLKAVSSNLYDYYVGNIDIYNSDNVNKELLSKQSRERLDLYNYTFISKVELSMMQMNAKIQIDENFDSLEFRQRAISDASTIMSEALALTAKNPKDFSTKLHLIDRTKDFAEGELLDTGKTILDNHFSNTPDSVKQAMFAEMELIYACTDMFGKPSVSEQLGCASSLGSDLLNTLNEAYSAWTLFKSSKALNTLTVLDRYLTEYFLAGEDLNFLYTQYNVDNEADLITKIKDKVLAESNSFWTIGDDSFDSKMFTIYRENFIKSVRGKTDAMIKDYGLKADYNALDHSFLIPAITKGKYDVETNEFSICYTLDNNSYFDIEKMSLTMKIDDESTTLLTSKNSLDSMSKKTNSGESCVNVPFNNTSGFDGTYFLATATVNFEADNQNNSAEATKVIYLSENNLYDLLQQVAPPTIIIEDLHRTIADNNIYYVSAAESYVDPLQGTLSFEWKQVDIDNFKINIEYETSSIPSIAIPELPIGITQKTVWIEVSATASISKHTTTETYKIIIDASEQPDVDLPIAYAGADIQIDSGMSVQFQGKNTNSDYLNSDDDIEWRWLNENHELVSSEQSFEKRFDQAGVYTFKLEINDDNRIYWDLISSDTIIITVGNGVSICSESQKLVNNECVAKTCQDDSYNCPTCNSNQGLVFDVDGSGYCFECSVHEKLVDNQCIVKTCEDDIYYCPACTSSQELKYNIDGSGYCEDAEQLLVPRVTNLTPLVAIQNIATIFTIEGENLPDTIAMSLQDSVENSCKIISKSSATVQMSCIPSSTGSKSIYVAAQTGANAMATDISLIVNIEPNAVGSTSADFTNACYDSPKNPFDQWANDWYECTRYAFGRACETTGEELTYTQDADRHGGKWYDIINAEYQRGSEPKANSLAVWSYGDYGHVAYVEGVDGDNVTISEANWDANTDEAKYGGQKTLTKTQMLTRGSSSQYQLVGYVYLTKYPTITLSPVISQQQGKEFSFQANLSESLNTQYSLKISLGDGGGGYLAPISMTPNATTNLFTFTYAISTAGERVYRVAIFNGDNIVSAWTDGAYTVISTPLNQNFTTDWLNGRRLYNAFLEPDLNAWELHIHDFTDTSISSHTDGNNEAWEASYTITSEGYISLVEDGSNELEYIKAVSKTTDYIRLCWSDEFDHMENCTGDAEYFYFDYQKARDFVDAQNNNLSNGFTTELLAGKTFYIINENSDGGETCILEQIYTASTVTQKEWVYHSADNWTSGCQEDFGEYTDIAYTITDGVMQWDDGEDWPYELNEILSDYYVVTDPDKNFFHLYFSKDKVNSILEGSSDLAGLKFTTDWLSGRTLYNAYSDSDMFDEWGLFIMSFTGTTTTGYMDNNNSDRFDDISYTITDEGYITFYDPNDGKQSYIKAVSQTTDYIRLCWTDETDSLSTCTGDDEYFYFDYQKARDLVDAQNNNVTNGFTVEQLSARTLYYVQNDDFGHDEQVGFNVAEMIFNSDGTMVWNEIETLDSGAYNTTYSVDNNGHLFLMENEEGGGEYIYTSQHSDYLKVCEMDNNDCETYFFFDRQKALDFRDERNYNISNDLEELIVGNTFYTKCGTGVETVTWQADGIGKMEDKEGNAFYAEYVISGNVLITTFEDGDEESYTYKDSTSTYIRYTGVNGDILTDYYNYSDAQNAPDNDCGDNNPVNQQVDGLEASDGTYYNKIEISWDEVSGVTEGANYELYRCTDTSTNNCVLISRRTNTSHTDEKTDGIKANTTYYYRIRIQGVGNEVGDFSDYDIGYLDRVEPIVTEPISSQGTHGDRVHVSWVHVSGASSYNVYACNTFGINSENILNSSECRSVTSQTAYHGDTGEIYTEVYDTNVVPGVKYWYHVRAKKDGDYGEFSRWSNSGYAGLEIPLVPTISTVVDVTTYGDPTPTLSITPTPPGEHGAKYYKVYRCTDVQIENCILVQDVLPYNRVYDNQISYNTDYYYRARSVSYSGNISEFSDYAIGRAQ